MTEQKLSRTAIVLGKNYGVFWNRRRLLKQEDILSEHSRLSVHAAYLLYSNGLATRIAFVTGHTSGISVPSEAEAMRRLAIQHGVPEKDILVFEQSLDTEGNAQEVADHLDELNDQLLLITVGFHMRRALLLFRKFGINHIDSWISEEAYELLLPSSGYVNRYRKTLEVRLETVKEAIGVLAMQLGIYEFLQGFVLKSRRRK